MSDMSNAVVSGSIHSDSTFVWRDRKRYLWLFGLLMPALIFIALGAYAATGWGVWLWLGPIVTLVIVPVVDLLVGADPSNPPDEAIAALEADRYYRWLTYAFLPVQYGGFVAACWAIMRWDLSTLNQIALAVTTGFAAGIGINIAHELGHKRDDVERWMSKTALAQCFYGHFYVEHNRGHHVRVATPQDPASSRVGESFYRFWPRTVVGSLVSAWGLESKRIARRGKHPFRPGNNLLNAWVMSVVLWAIMIAWLGWGLLPFLLIQAVIGFSLLEVVNYLEHYGMLRQRVGNPGHERYERVRPEHSWNANDIATNVLLYNLQRHSDHHANPTRRYQALRNYQDAPQLPTGYAGMVLLAGVPPLWRRVMDQRVLAHYEGDMSRANISPAKRDRVLAKYPKAAELPDQREPATPATQVATPAAEATPASGAQDPASATTDSHCWRCPGCGYIYDERVGAPAEGFDVGTAWAAIPESWCCPDCGVREKVDFVAATDLTER
ncbi:MAG: fatty acid desaturase [Actinomycetes bacterium]